jgi:hypothetical protein
MRKIKIKIKKNICSLCFFCFITILSSCAPKIAPIKTNQVNVRENFAILSQKEFDLAIQPQHWNDAPHDLENYFTLFYIVFRNKTGQPIQIKKEDFVLIGKNGEQYSLFDSEQVVEIMYGGDFYYDDLNYFFESDEEAQKRLQDELDQRIEGIRNIQLKAFPFATIRPGAQLTGYIFFKKVSLKKGETFYIYYLDNEIPFTVES